MKGYILIIEESKFNSDVTRKEVKYFKDWVTFSDYKRRKENEAKKNVGVWFTNISEYDNLHNINLSEISEMSLSEFVELIKNQ